MNQGKAWGFRLVLALGKAAARLDLPTGASAQSSVEELGPTGELPEGLVIDSAGTTYTANYDSNRVSRVDSSGKTVREWGATGQFPSNVVVGPLGQVFVVNSWSASVLVFRPQKGFLRTLEPTGRSPDSAAVDRDGNLLVTNGLDSTASRFTPSCVSGAYALARGNLSCSAPRTPRVKLTPARSEFLGKREITVWFRPRRGVSKTFRLRTGG